MTDPIEVTIESDNTGPRVDPETGTIETDTDDGGVVVQLDARKDADEEGGFFENLALRMDAGELGAIAEQLHEEITADDESRSQYLQNITRGLDLLGLRLKEPKTDVGDSSSDVAGMSTVDNPLLLEAILKGWANARSELLPAEGPVKVFVAGDANQVDNALADKLEQGLNEYLTVGAPEYYPDTSHMLLWGTYFKGSGFKKIDRCPMRRRPVSESVDAKDLIVSDTLKDFRSCSRITNEIEMKKSVMKRMILLGVYRDVSLPPPGMNTNAVDEKIARIQGTQIDNKRPEKKPYTIWECQCELDLDIGFDHESMSDSEFKGEGIPLPYRVTMDKDSRQILAIRRDWREDDDQCQRIRLYVKYPYIPGPGFYGTGMLGILGNSTAALTAAWREALDAGMFANFPGGIIVEQATRQNTSNFRLSPGEFVPVRSNGLAANQMIAPLPYKDVSGGLLSLMEQIQAQAKELGNSAEIPAGEGLTNVPVGTMLSQIEQATKVMAAAHKDMHQAQALEIEMIVDLFRDHPEDFYRHNKNAQAWDPEQLRQALSDFKLIPRSDPNIPSHIHRVMKAVAYVNLMQSPLAPYFNGKMIAEMVVRALKDNPAEIVVDPPPQAQGDPAALLAAQAKAQTAQNQQQANAIKASEINTKASDAEARANIDMARLQAEQQLENTKLAKEEIIHRNDALKDHRDFALSVRDQALKERQASHDANMDHAEHALNVHTAMHPPKESK